MLYASSSQRRDPVVIDAVKALDLVLRPEMPQRRLAFICKVLDSAYPRGYIRPGGRLPPRQSSGKWNPLTIKRYLAAS